MTGFNDTLKNGIRRVYHLDDTTQVIKLKTNESVEVYFDNPTKIPSELKLDFTECNNAEIKVFLPFKYGGTFALKNLYLSHTYDRNIELSYQPVINNELARINNMTKFLVPYKIIGEPQIEGNTYTYQLVLNTEYASLFYCVLIVKQSKNENTESFEYKFNMYNYK